MSDPGRGRRWIEGVVAAMVFSGVVGVSNLLARLPSLERAVLEAAGSTAAAFWVLFPILYLCHIRRSPATLEFQERLRVDEEALKRRK